MARRSHLLDRPMEIGAGSSPEINWTAVRATDFRNAQIQDGKQAEFLMHESFPWERAVCWRADGASGRAAEAGRGDRLNAAA